MPRAAAPEHAALGDVQHRLARLGGVGAVERDLLDLAHELARAAFAHDTKRAVLDVAISSPPAVNVPANTTRRALWLMLMKPPAPARRGPKRLTLTLPSASTCAMPRHAMSSPPPS